jgi:hypothetical protein
MRKPAALFLAAFATVAGGGLAVAVEGSPASSSRDVPDGPPFADMEWVGDLPPGPPAHANANGQQVEEVEEVEEVLVEVQAQEEDETTEVTPTTENHGAVVSEAAHTCEPGPGHGECVSEVARENHGHADDETEVEEPETEEPETEELPGEGNGHTNSNGRGHGQGNGRGHERDGG